MEYNGKICTKKDIKNFSKKYIELHGNTTSEELLRRMTPYRGGRIELDKRRISGILRSTDSFVKVGEVTRPNRSINTVWGLKT